MHAGGFVVEAHAERILAFRHGVHLALEQPAQHDDAPIAGPQMLLRMQRDRTLPGLRFPVAGKALVLLFGQLPPELAVHLRAPAPELAALADPARGIDTEVGIVDRHHPADGLHPAVASDARIRHHAQRRQDRLGDAQEHAAICELAHAGRLEAARRGLELHLRHHAHHGHELRAAEAAVQDRHVIRIHQVLVVLQPVARHDDAAARAYARVVRVDELAGRELLQRVEPRQRGLLLRRPHVGEYQAVALLERIPGLAHGVSVLRAGLGLAGLLEAVALHVEEPAVITAADAALVDAAIIETDAAMAAAGGHEARPRGAIAGEAEGFPQDAARAPPSGRLGAQAR